MDHPPVSEPWHLYPTKSDPPIVATTIAVFLDVSVVFYGLLLFHFGSPSLVLGSC